MKFPLTFTFKKKEETYSKSVSIPTNWGDCTLGQCIDISQADVSEKGFKVKLLSILTGLSTEEILSSSDVDYWNSISTLIEFIAEEPDMKSFEFPRFIKIGETKCNIPKDLTLETYGQKIALEELIRTAAEGADGKLNVLELMPTALSIYFYPIIAGQKFNDERVDEFTDLMKSIPVKYAFPVAGFFLSKFGISRKSNG